MADDTMPTTYDTKTTTTTSSAGPAIGFHPEYLRTIPGILKIVEIVLDILVFICACVNYFPGGGWAQFVAISAFLTTLVLLILILVNAIYRIPGPMLLIELIYYAVFSVFFLIAAIVAAAKGSWADSVGATAFFAFAATAVYVVDTVFQFRAYRTGQAESVTTTSATTTTTTVESGRTTTY